MTQDGLFNVEIWGTVGQWAAAFGTISLGALNLWFSRRGTRRAEELERQGAVRSLSVHVVPLERGPFAAELRVFNAASTPFRDLRVEFEGDVEGYEALMMAERFLAPGDLWNNNISRKIYEGATDYAVTATDAYGRRWRRSGSGAIIELKETSPRRWWQVWRRGQ